MEALILAEAMETNLLKCEISVPRVHLFRERLPLTCNYSQYVSGISRGYRVFSFSTTFLEMAV